MSLPEKLYQEVGVVHCSVSVFLYLTGICTRSNPKHPGICKKGVLRSNPKCTPTLNLIITNKIKKIFLQIHCDFLCKFLSGSGLTISCQICPRVNILRNPGITYGQYCFKGILGMVDLIIYLFISQLYQKRPQFMMIKKHHRSLTPSCVSSGRRSVPDWGSPGKMVTESQSPPI